MRSSTSAQVRFPPRGNYTPESLDRCAWDRLTDRTTLPLAEPAAPPRRTLRFPSSCCVMATASSTVPASGTSREASDPSTLPDRPNVAPDSRRLWDTHSTEARLRRLEEAVEPVRRMLRERLWSLSQPGLEPWASAAPPDTTLNLLPGPPPLTRDPDHGPPAGDAAASDAAAAAADAADAGPVNDPAAARAPGDRGAGRRSRPPPAASGDRPRPWLGLTLESRIRA